MIVFPNDDLYFSKEYDCLPLKDLIDDCQIVFFDLADDYFDGTIDYEKLVNVLKSFFR